MRLLIKSAVSILLFATLASPVQAATVCTPDPITIGTAFEVAANGLQSGLYYYVYIEQPDNPNHYATETAAALSYSNGVDPTNFYVDTIHSGYLIAGAAEFEVRQAGPPYNPNTNNRIQSLCVANI